MNEPVNPKPGADGLVAAHSQSGPQSGQQSSRRFGAGFGRAGSVAGGSARSSAGFPARAGEPVLRSRGGGKIIPSAFEFFN